jgi:hypothetical protein
MAFLWFGYVFLRICRNFKNQSNANEYLNIKNWIATLLILQLKKETQRNLILQFTWTCNAMEILFD